jgi:hypothetical protein
MRRIEVPKHENDSGKTGKRTANEIPVPLALPLYAAVV